MRLTESADRTSIVQPPSETFAIQSSKAHPKRLELPVRIAVSRITESPTASRRRFCLPSTLAHLAGFELSDRASFGNIR